MIDWIRLIINYCNSIFQTSIYVGSGYTVTLWNVIVFAVIGYLMLRIVFDVLR